VTNKEVLENVDQKELYLVESSFANWSITSVTCHTGPDETDDKKDIKRKTIAGW